MPLLLLTARSTHGIMVVPHVALHQGPLGTEGRSGTSLALARMPLGEHVWGGWTASND